MANSIPDMRRLPVTVGDTIFVIDSFQRTREGVVQEITDEYNVRFINMKTSRINTASRLRFIKVQPRG